MFKPVPTFLTNYSSSVEENGMLTIPSLNENGSVLTGRHQNVNSSNEFSRIVRYYISPHVTLRLQFSPIISLTVRFKRHFSEFLTTKSLGLRQQGEKQQQRHQMTAHGCLEKRPKMNDAPTNADGRKRSHTPIRPKVIAVYHVSCPRAFPGGFPLNPGS